MRRAVSALADQSSQQYDVRSSVAQTGRLNWLGSAGRVRRDTKVDLAEMWARSNATVPAADCRHREQDVFLRRAAREPLADNGLPRSGDDREEDEDG
jgi:hypothetical protein